MMEEQSDFNASQQPTNSLIHINQQHLLRTILSKWWVIVICGCIGGIVAMFINKYSQPVYMSKTTVLLQDDSDHRGIDLTEGIKLSNSLSSIENQIYIYKSPKMVELALQHLDFGVTFYRRGKLRDAETYGMDQLIRVEIDSSHIQPMGATFEVKHLSGDTYSINAKGANVACYNYQQRDYTGHIYTNVDTTFQVRIGEMATCKMFSFRIVPYTCVNLPEDWYGVVAFSFTTPQELVSQWAGSISIYPESKESTITNITCRGFNRRKTMEFLSALNKAAVEYNLNKKNEAAERTLNFIGRQLSLTSDSLRKATARLSQFKQKNGFTGNSDYGSTLQSTYYEQNREMQTILAENDLLALIVTNLESGDRIEDYFLTTSASKNNGLIQSQLQELMTLQQELYFTSNENESNPFRKQLEDKERLLRANIKTLLNQSIDLNNKRIQELDKGNRRLVAEADRLPELENKRVDLERDYKIQDAVYTFMLQKESETLIAKASTVADSEVLQEPVCIGAVAPQTQQNMMYGIGIGLAIPLVLFILLELMNKKIRSLSELKDTVKDKKPLVTVPILDHTLNYSETPLLDYPNCATSESFRELRLKLGMLVLSNNNKMIMFTSCNPGEGKTYCAVNTAIALAQNHKKTLLINYDLRRPRMENILPQKGNRSITEYLLGLATEEEIIQKSEVENLYYISCDSEQLPPNPAEQIASIRNKELLESLKDKFDVIIMDTAPIGCVSDCKALEPIVGTIVFVVRANSTEFSHLTSTLEDIDSHKTYLVYNGAQKKDFGYKQYYRNYSKQDKK